MSIGGKKIIHIKKKENSEKRFTNPSDQAIANEHKNAQEKIKFFFKCRAGNWILSNLHKIA